MRLLVITICFLSLSSCLTQKKREDITHRFLREHPKVLADLAALHYPSVVRPGVPVIVRDTIVEVERDIEVVDSIVYVRDVEWRTITVKERVVDTIPDHALAESLMMAKFEVERKLYRSEAELENEKERSKQRLWWLIGAIAAVTGVLGFNIYSFLKPGIKI